MANFLKSLFVKGIEIDPAGATSAQVLSYNGTKFVPVTNSATATTSATDLTSGTLDNARLPAAATNITSVGTLTSLTVSGTVTVPTPTNSTDAVTKAYADAITQSLDIKDSVRVASTVNIAVASALTNTSTIDGVVVATGDRVLLKNQTTATENGIYVVVASGAASRSTDANTSAKVTSGMYVFVSEGTVSADMGYVLTTNDAITLGTTALSFTQFSGAGQITAGTGLSKSGNTLSVNAAQTGITSVSTLDSLAVTGNLAVDTSVLFVDSSNNRVGIGTATPLSPLHIADTSGYGVQINTTTNLGLIGSNSESDGLRISGGIPDQVTVGGNMYLYGNTHATRAADIALMSNGNEILTVDGATLRVGIGVLSPATALDIIGTATVRAAATQDGVALAGRAGGTSTYEVTLTPTTLTADRTLTLPDASGTVAFTDSAITSSTFIGTTSVALNRSSGALTLAGITLTTPVLGVASATTVNKVAFTAPATGSTLTIAEGKTLTASNTLTLTGTDASSVAFGAGGTVAYTSVTTLSSLISVGTIGTGVWQGTAIAGQYGGTGVANTGKTITLGGNLTTSGAFTTTLTVTANTSVTLPTSGTLTTTGKAIAMAIVFGS